MKKFKIGLQLYSVRDQMAEDMEGTLKAVAEMGYECVEMAGYFGKTAEEIRALLDKYHLTCPSIHQAIDFYENGGQEAVDFVKKLGITYSTLPWYHADRLPGTPAWEQTKELFIRTGRLLKENGIQMLYHNHDFEFKKLNGRYLHDIMMEEIPADLLRPEFDLGWVHYAGADCCAYIKKYSGQIKIVHLKDFDCKELAGGPAYDLIDENGNPMKVPSKEDNQFRYRPVGQGRLDVPAILSACEDAGVEYLIVEQDEVYDTPSLEAVRQSREYLRQLGQ